MTDRRNQILDAATSLFLEQGVSVPTAKIAKAAGVSNGTLFNVFPTKQALIDAIYTEAKIGMFANMRYCGEDPLTKVTLRANWDGYMNWANRYPERRRVMHLLLDAGLASADAQAEVSAVVEPHAAWIYMGLDRGIIRGPSVSFIGQLVFFHIDLVINEQLDRQGENLAFEMLCNAIGLNP
ncbi:TetR/AcrR family transcriptional regulator [Salinispirillum marinum]|uniref:TetR/AcrR family transcriptional regulator n=2 Tax=Saccharospirillaceae TaxID=255527 RepID=A0ABV8BI93_9GAMM